MVMASKYDVAVIGGGLAGLAASILLQQKGYAVILFEKENYPHHKVCGEYISLESHGFLSGLGLPLNEMDLPMINKLLLTAPNGNAFTTRLPLGGFGISRFALDHRLAQLAEGFGVRLLTNTRVDDVFFETDLFRVMYRGQEITAKTCLGSFGKRSNLDVKWQRPFSSKSKKGLDNYIGVKYHIQTNAWPPDTIGLHNFENGYCGISKIEGDRYCLCYLTTAAALKNHGNSIPQMEQQLLCRNPHLKKIFSESEFQDEFPVTISQISFSKKSTVEKHILMLGDAAGMITPLCGNGMSIALHTAKIAADVTARFLNRELTRDRMESIYRKEWEGHFARRLATGRILQRFFGSERKSNFFVKTFRNLPLLARPVVKMTHGESF